MSHSSTTTTDTHEGERKLVRPSDDRLIAGVSSGLARYFDMNPLVYRVAFSALVLLGGAGLVLYGAAWLVIPDERRGESLVEEAVRDRRQRPWLVVGVALVVLGLLFGIAESSLWPDPGDVWLVVLVVGLSLVMWQAREGPRDSGASAKLDTGETTRRPRRLPVFLPTIGVVIAAVGILGILEATDAVDVDWVLALAGIVVAMGLAVAVGAFFGGAGVLASLGVLLAAVMVFAVSLDLPLKGHVGERVVSPSSLAELDREYRVAVGRLVVDLRDVALPPGETSVSASVGIGELVVHVPPAARVEVNADVTAGDSEVFGRQEDGWDVEQDDSVAGAIPSAPTLVLDADVGLGHLEVRRD